MLEVDGEKVLVSGRIDRIDVGEFAGQPCFTVLDYKTGSGYGYTKKAVLSGDMLQLTLYALAVQNLLLAGRHAVPKSVGYWFVSENGYREMLSMYQAEGDALRPTPDWDALHKSIVARVLGLVHGVRAGEFPMASRDPQCTSRCPYSTVCRVNQVRSLEKPWPSAPA